MESKSENKEPAIVILSGGADSVTTLYYAIKKGYDVSCLNFNYGQNHYLMESKEAKWHCNKLGVSLTHVDLRDTQTLLESSLTGLGVIPDVPEVEEHFETLKSTVVPNRNAIMLSIAYGYAISKRAIRIYYGAHASDKGVYPDCRRGFITLLNHAFEAGNWSKREDRRFPTIIAPFSAVEKSRVIVEGIIYGVDYSHTYSCYKGGEQHCGVCSSCLERKRAFEEANVTDPTRYKE